MNNFGDPTYDELSVVEELDLQFKRDQGINMSPISAPAVVSVPTADNSEFSGIKLEKSQKKPTKASILMVLIGLSIVAYVVKKG